MGITFGNFVAIPLIFVEAICSFESSDVGSADKCQEEGSTRVFTAALAYLFLMFGLAQSYLKCQVARLECSNVEQSGCGTMEQTSETSNVQNEFNNAMPVSNEIMQTTVSGTSKVITSQQMPIQSNKMLEWWNIFKNLVLLNPPVIANLLGQLVAYIEPVQNFLFGPSAPLKSMTGALRVLSQASVPLMSLQTAATLGHQLMRLKHASEIFGGGDDVGISKRTMLVFVLGRVIFAPAAIMGITIAMLDVFPEDRWGRMVLFMITIAPTANILVLIANLMGRQQEARLLAAANVAQFFVFIPTSMLFVSIGMSFTEELKVSS